jgi:hypothetical protein
MDMMDEIELERLPGRVATLSAALGANLSLEGGSSAAGNRMYRRLKPAGPRGAQP